MDNLVSLEEVLTEQLRDPEFRKEHAALQAEFDSEQARIEKELRAAEPEENSDES